MDAENPNNSIGAVAARIQERALQLQAERATLAAAQAELQDLEAVLYEEDKQNATVRRNMLITVRERHGVELELIKVHEQRQELLVHVQENREQAVETEGRTEQLQEEWEETVHRVYADHQVHREIFARTVEAKIRSREERTKERDEHLGRLSREAKMYAKEEEAIREEKKELLASIQDLNDKEEEEDEEIARLAERVRRTVGEKSALRRSVQEAKEEFQEANAEMLRWEEACFVTGRA